MKEFFVDVQKVREKIKFSRIFIEVVSIFIDGWNKTTKNLFLKLRDRFRTALPHFNEENFPHISMSIIFHIYIYVQKVFS